MLKRFVLAAVAIVLLSTTTTAVAALMEVKDDANLLGLGEALRPEAREALDDVPDSGPKTIMVLGSDLRAQDGRNARSRSDTVMLIRLDPDKGATSVMSLPRDLQVTIYGSVDKLNAAYATGGEALTIRTVKSLLAPYSPTGRFPISHVVNVRFGAFQRAVNYLDCVYVDIDRRYFNDNNPPNGGGPRYSEIDIPAGYQRLCGADALAYVRYRHFDSDLVRAARQQEFLRQSKDQIGLASLVSNRKELLRIIGRYTRTDIRGTNQILSLAKLLLRSSEKPLREIQFPSSEVGTFVTPDRTRLGRAVRRFMNADLGVARPRPPEESDAERSRPGQATKRRRSTLRVIPRTQLAVGEAEATLTKLQASMPIPVLYPKLKASGSLIQPNDSRGYVVEDRQNHKFPSYRIVVRLNEVGQYYGIQGTTWRNPPILDEETERRTIDGREFRIYKDGTRIRLIGLKTAQGSYWVSNSLMQTLTNRQMLAIAGSLRRVGSN